MQYNPGATQYPAGRLVEPTTDVGERGGFLTRNTTSYWGDIQQFFKQEDNQREIIIAPYVFSSLLAPPSILQSIRLAIGTPFPTVDSLAASLNAEGEEEGATKRTWRGLKNSVVSLFSNLRTSEWADSIDSGAYDSTCHAAQAREDAGDHGLNPGTFYCSFTGTISVKEEGSAHHRPDRSFKSDIFMYIMAKMVGSFSYNLSPLPSFLLAKPTPTLSTTLKVSRRRRRLEICASEPITPVEEEATSPSSALGVDWLGQESTAKPRPSLSTHSTSTSYSSNLSASSGSSGWHSRTSSSSLNTPAEEDCEQECTWPAMRHSHSRQVSAVSMTSMDEGEEQEEEGVKRGHHRRWSSTDWYASIAANWLPKSVASPPITPVERRGVAPGLLAMKKHAKKQARHEPVVVEEEEVKVKGEQKLRDDLWENDGVVPMFSQIHPSECSIHHCQHHGSLSLDTTPKKQDGDCNGLHIGTFDKGVWHVFTSRGLSHNTFVGGISRYESRRAALWTKISEAVKDLDLTARAQRSPSMSPAKFVVTPPSP
ncbi:3671_t:CDS:2 [Acaulospora colombiana]|uniref:3671_t:CDS:1 n=1 Tax=Acaulospora colombiana TaxID=27376 RepID=A0ACA9KH27_9GLOM|nr:3671_t:CDS:2 [Acaulospora colombiana]